jgi:dTDP-4-amino-4,6-dideoxygalactose transaminase
MQSLTAAAVPRVPSVPPEERVGPARGLSIPQVDLRAEYAAIKDEIDAAIAAVVAQTAFIRGPFTTAFEKDWAAYCGASHAVGCANGTAAIQLALAALGVGAGDEVITTPMTFIATVEAIVHTGATPVLAEVIT